MSAKVFTTVDGGSYRIGDFGTASRLWDAEKKVFVDVGVTVPDDVAERFEREIRGISHFEDVEDPDNPGRTKKQAVKFARGESKHLRVERDPAPAPPARKATTAPAPAAEKKE
jgi:hypothetical protein